MRHFLILIVIGGKLMENEILLPNGEDIVRIESMADGLRNTGYKSIYNALAEIVDNGKRHNICRF